MMDFTKITIGSEVYYSVRPNKKNPNPKPPVKCKVVYIFKAFEIPRADKVVKYYGGMVVNPKYASLFGPNKSDRIVLKRGKKDFIIIPVHNNTLSWIDLKLVEAN